MYSPMANPQLTSLAGTGQLTACLLLSPGKEAALVHKTSTDYKTSFSPTLLNNTLSLPLHSSSRAAYVLTCYKLLIAAAVQPSSAGVEAWKSVLRWNQSRQSEVTSGYLHTPTEMLHCPRLLQSGEDYQEVSGDNSSKHLSRKKAIAIICFCPYGSCLYQLMGPGKLYQLIPTPVIKRTALCS